MANGEINMPIVGISNPHAGGVIQRLARGKAQDAVPHLLAYHKAHS